MKKHRSLFSILMIILLLFPTGMVPIEAQEVNEDEWEFDFFGSNTSDDKNPKPTYNDDGSITLEALGGKVARNDEGLSFYSTELPAEKNFEIKTRVKVDNFNQDKSIGTPNQKSFGLILKDEKYTDTSNYIAVGALDTVMKGFYKQEDLSTDYIKLDPFENMNMPVAGEEYDLTIKKSGETYELAINDDRERSEERRVGKECRRRRATKTRKESKKEQ